MITFGPVPSRRLGRSLGINNIPSSKICSYSCVYCQVGATKTHTNQRCACYQPEDICHAVEQHLKKLQPSEMPDYLTFVANGEPTLDINLAASISKLKPFGIPIAVISNASLLSNPNVRNDLVLADWVSVKVDTVVEELWRKQNRPVDSLEHSVFLSGLNTFSKEYTGTFVTETMLVDGLNDSHDSLERTASFIQSLHPEIAYISIPTRPPYEKWVKKPDEMHITQAHQLYTDAGLHTELILGYEGSDVGFTGNPLDDVVGICSVHPLREDALLELLKKNQADPVILDILLQTDAIRKVSYQSHTYYIRSFKD